MCLHAPFYTSYMPVGLSRHGTWGVRLRPSVASVVEKRRISCETIKGPCLGHMVSRRYSACRFAVNSRQQVAKCRRGGGRTNFRGGKDADGVKSWDSSFLSGVVTHQLSVRHLGVGPRVGVEGLSGFCLDDSVYARRGRGLVR